MTLAGCGMAAAGVSRFDTGGVCVHGDFQLGADIRLVITNAVLILFDDGGSPDCTSSR